MTASVAHMRGGTRRKREEDLHYMAGNKKTSEELSVDEKIAQKMRKIKRLFRDMPSDRKQFADGLIYQFAVTSVTLERLAEEINKGEVIEDFVQGSQRLRREAPALKAYNSTVKSFTTLSKSLLDLLPEKAQKQAGNELMGFITQPKTAGGKA